ncbi:MAG: VanW family protein [Thermoleophilia bacterium]
MRPPIPRSPAGRALAISAIAVVLLVAGVVLARAVGTPDDRVPAGVSIAGIPVGGLTPAQAERAVAGQAGAPTGVVVVDRPGEPGFPMRVPVADLAPIPRARVAVERAMEQPSLAQRILREIGLGSDREIALDYRVEGAALNRLVARVKKQLTRAPRDAAVRVADGALTLTAARDGRRVREVRLRAALMRLPERVVVPVAAVAPAVDDDAARTARIRAERLAQGPVRVTNRARSATLPRRTLLRALTFTPAAGAIAVGIDPDAIAPVLRETFGPLEREPVSARFRVSGERVEVVPGRAGRTVDAAGVARALERGAGARSVRVRITTIAPALTTAQAREMGITELVSEFSTPYACCQPRVTNIKRGAAIMDGTIIPEGGTFSLNEVLGERTTARGFVPAPQINAGKLEDAVGGGVSQIATTMFNAAFFAGLHLVSHTPHEFWITRYPPGREATVSWGGPELIVENDWPAAMLVKAEATDEGITIRLYSSKLGRRVTTTSSDNAVAGTAFTSTYTRKVYRGDDVIRDENWSWTYKEPPPD